jgi:hypothetical protein
VESAPIYRIVNWPRGYDEWVATYRPKDAFIFLPFSDSLECVEGYSRLVRGRQGAAYLGVWCSLIKIAASCFPKGVLINSEGRGLNSAALSRRSQLPSKLFVQAIPFLRDELKWIEEISRIDVTALIEEVKAKRR